MDKLISVKLGDKIRVVKKNPNFPEKLAVLRIIETFLLHKVCGLDYFLQNENCQKVLCSVSIRHCVTLRSSYAI